MKKRWLNGLMAICCALSPCWAVPAHAQEEQDFPGYSIVEDMDMTSSGELFKVQYEGEWSGGTSYYPELFHDGYEHYAHTGDYYEMRFIGTKVEIWASVAEGHGSYTVTIDGEEAGQANATAETRLDQQLIYTSDELEHGEHTIKVELVGQEGKAIQLDYLKVYHEELAPTAITLDRSEVTMTPGSTTTLIASVEPWVASEDEIVWTSSDPAVVSVDDGILHAADVEERTSVIITAASAADTDVFAQAKVIVDPDGPKLEFVVLSDTHVQSGASSSSAVNFDSGLNDIVTTMPEVKTVINCGDFSSDGADGEFARYYAILDEYDEDLQFLNALGNHDVRWTSMGWEGVRERYMDYNQKYMNGSEEVYHDMWIGEGEDQYHFIVLNTEWDLKDSSYLSDEQLNWLDETMAEGAEEGKPIFVALHEPLRNSIANTDSDQGESDFPLDEGAQDFALKEILRKYPQTVLFTGHVHAGLGANEIIERDYGTQVNVPSFLRADSGEPQNQLGYHVAVYEDRVQLSLRDFEHDTWCAEGGYTIDLTDEAVPGKVLDIPFDDESASDVSGHGHDGTVYGDVEYVDGVEGKAIRLRNDPAALSASQYVDLGPLHFGEDDFTIMFWYKGTEEMDTEGAVLANKDWTTGGNQGLAIGTFTQPRPGIGLNFTAEGSSRRDTERYASATDGEWHHIAATVDRDGMMALYVDGQLCEEVDISADEGKRIDVDQLPLILGADGRKQYPVNDACIDELKIYRYAIEAYELESVRGPYRISAGQDSAVLSWEALDERFCPAYVLFDGEQISVSADAQDVVLDGLAPGREYTVEVITRDRAYARNMVFGHSLSFKTEGEEPPVQADKTLLAQILRQSEKAVNDADRYIQDDRWETFMQAYADAQRVYDNEQVVQGEIDQAALALADAYAGLRLAPDEELLAELESFLQATAQISEACYSREELSIIADVRAEAQELLAAENIDEDRFAQLNEKMNYVLELIAQREQTENTPSDEEGGEENEGADDADTADDAQKLAQDAPDTAAADSANTMLALLVSAGAASALAYRRKRS